MSTDNIDNIPLSNNDIINDSTSLGFDLLEGVTYLIRCKVNYGVCKKGQIRRAKFLSTGKILSILDKHTDLIMDILMYPREATIIREVIPNG